MGADVPAKREPPSAALAALLAAFPDCEADLNEILAMLDDGRFVDVKALPDVRMKMLVQTLFSTLGLNQTPFLSLYYLPLNAPRTLSTLCPTSKVNGDSLMPQREDTAGPDAVADVVDGARSEGPPPVIGPMGRPEPTAVSPTAEPSGAPQEGRASAVQEGAGPVEPSTAQPAPRKRAIGPAMPSPEVLAAAARMTGVGLPLEEEDEDEIVGPMPSAAAPENATQVERYEEVARVLEAVVEGKNAYVLLGVPPSATPAEIKRRYRRASLLVHPDKCTHQKAPEAFAVLNKAHLELEDPNKRAAVDRKIEDEKDREAREEERKAERVAAEWRKIRGEALAGDEEILSGPTVPLERDTWMTELPPERQAGSSVVVTQSSAFSRTEKRARGDTSMWTDTPALKLQLAQQGYIQGTAHAHAIEAGPISGDATGGHSAETLALVQEYNEKRRGKTLMEQHQEKILKESKEKKKKMKKAAASGAPQEIVFRPWDRDRDMAGPRSSSGMNAGAQSQHLASRFVSTQRK